MNCLQPACVSVCPVGALQKTALGPVTYDADKCMGCRYCMQACPFQVPSYEWSSRLPKMRKCNMCYERQSAGEADRLRGSLPGGRHGEWRPRRVDPRRRSGGWPRKPDQYYGKIYGIEEVGGTSVLYLSAVPFAQIGLRTNVPHEPLAGDHLARAGTGARRGVDRHGAVGRNLLDHQPARGSGQERGTAMTRKLRKSRSGARYSRPSWRAACMPRTCGFLRAGRIHQPER
jgi:NAD-dependent dihydropyrimidine dehydrogenase PreA subunit